MAARADAGKLGPAIQQSLSGSPITWMKQVTDDQYLKGPQHADA